MFVLTAATLFYTLGNRRQFARGLVTITIIGPLTSFLLVKYSFLSGWVGVVYNFVASLPWLFHVMQTKRASGISEKSLMFIYGAQACTFIYALLIGSVPLIVGVASGFSVTSLIVRYYYRYRTDKSPK